MRTGGQGNADLIWDDVLMSSLPNQYQQTQLSPQYKQLRLKLGLSTIKDTFNAKSPNKTDRYGSRNRQDKSRNGARNTRTALGSSRFYSLT